MELLALVFRYIHLIAFAGAVGGILMQLSSSERVFPRIVRDSLFTQLVTGIILVGLREPEVDHLKITVKLAILVVMLIIVMMQRKNTAVSPRAYLSMVVLLLVEAGVAVFW